MRKLNYYGLAAIFLFLISCGEEQQGQGRKQGPMPVPVIEVPLKTVTGYTSYPVNIEGTINSAVRPKVTGYITEVLVDEGEAVNRGQVLFRLETETLSQEAAAARANVNAAKVEVEKLEPLVEKGIISPVQLETAKARLAQAQAGLNSIAASIGYATIKSPVDGYVGAINFRRGALVSPNDALTTVSDTDEVYAFFSMNERNYLDFLQNTEGQTLNDKIENFPPVQLELVNGELYEQEGEIETVTAQVNESTGTVSFRATFPNPNRLLANGNSGRIRIPEVFENVPVVPEAATYEQQGRVYVYQVQGDTLAVSAPIEVTERIDNLIIVKAGVGAGDKIVAQGVGKIRNNTPIQPRLIPFDSVANTLQVVFK